MPKPNKESGAYSVGGVLGLPKFYVFLNYDQTLDGVFALVHELGHSMHSSYQVEHQTIYCSTDTFCAEIASTVNEILLGLYLLEKNEENPKLKAMVYRRILDNFFGSTSAQVMYSAFELGVVNSIEKNDPVTPEGLYKNYLNACVKFAGMSPKRCTKAIEKKRFGGLTGIFRVEHFYAGDLYVYKYAVAMVVALRVAQLLYARDEKTLQKYLRFLSLGTSLPPLEIIASLGVDVRTPEVWREAGAFASKLLSEYISLLKRLKLN